MKRYLLISWLAAIVLLCHEQLYSQEPYIIYNKSQVYIKNKTIVPLEPINTGGEIPAIVYGEVSTFAGSGIAGSTDGTGIAATFNSPVGVAVDVSGNLYIADRANNKIRKITPAGVVSTLAGSGVVGSADGTGASASFYNPYGVAVDTSGNIYVADRYNHKIRKITPAGVVSTFAGSGAVGSADGTGTSASFSELGGIAIDIAGNLYVSDLQNQTIRKITPAAVVSTLAGSVGTAGFANGTGSAAKFNYPFGIAVDRTGNLYVADRANHRIRKITPGGLVSTVAGSGAANSIDGIDTVASFNNPVGVAVDSIGNIYVSDYGNQKIRKISAGMVSTLAGCACSGSMDGVRDSASFNNPFGIAVDRTGNLYVAEFTGNVIRKISTVGFTIRPSLPAGLNFDATAGIISGTPTAVAPITDYIITAYNRTGNSSDTVSIQVIDNLSPDINYGAGQIYVKNKEIPLLIPVNNGGSVPSVVAYGETSTFAGSGSYGFADGVGTTAKFKTPYGMVADNTGNIYVADRYNHRIRKITPAGVVSTFAGSGVAGSADGTGTGASFNEPAGIVIDSSGTLYISDMRNHTIRKITPAGVVSTLAGTVGTAGFADGTGSAAKFNYPFGLAVDRSGDVYVADRYNYKIRKITPVGVVTTIAGSTAGFADSSNPLTAKFNNPVGVAVDSAGNIYVGDYTNNRIRKITAAGVVSTLAGQTSPGSADGIGGAASFTNPFGVTVDNLGNVYVADYNNQKIRKITPSGIVSTLAGSGTIGLAEGIGSAASFKYPVDVITDNIGNLYVADGNNKIRKITITGYTINPELPGGLSLNAATGVISGTPSAVSPATNYIITAYNQAGNSSDTLNIEIINTPPHIAYPDVQNYIKNQIITPIAPVNTGGPVPATTYGETSTITISGDVSRPQGIAIDKSGNVYIADRAYHRIRKITPQETISTLAGSGTAGFADGSSATAMFNNPSDIAIDSAGNVYVSDIQNERIRKISPAGQVSTLAGDGSVGSSDGAGTSASFYYPFGLSLDSTGNLYVADRANHRIRKVTVSGTVSTFAGSTAGSIDGTGTSAKFNNPVGIAISQAGDFYIGDFNNNKIRKITSTGEVTTFAGTGSAGSADGSVATASFNGPFGMAFDGAGNLYIADYTNNKIRKIAPTGTVSTLAGSGTGALTDGIGTAASFKNPADVAADADGNLYVADYLNDRIRKIVTTGYTINPSLPTGLTFDNKTGVISGTPTVVSPATDYVVTAYNSAGSSSDTISIEVSDDLLLASRPTGNENMRVEINPENLIKADWSIYPNPVDNRWFRIVVPIAASKEKIVKIYDMTGRIVFSKGLTVNDGQANIYLPSRLMPGMYMVQVQELGVKKIFIR
ncbi:T9SS type A sorting domain-containing protein (plasmid) [Pedobacter sp. BS3]|uniref:putative Ig domain-containing protein n=1 Tax=Pedobacter sp. BS3 TaxID=2567937 RepID=UPI0011ED654E|nr:putative Ig domain-containing protein [Pedobacter sp. BS3]TZF86380.1 T9SS type A sorting domain-containing protein [Pedobacter sp. BS3]